MSDRIGKYVLEKPLLNANAGFSKWGIGRYKDREYFIKEFLCPVYPENESGMSQAQIEIKKKICIDFENRKKKLLNTINECSDGSVLSVEEFFRYGTKYYIATEKIPAIDINEVINLSVNDKFRILRVLAHGILCLHDNGIVHGDLKLDNILFYRTEIGTVTAKIIDIDSCFWVNNQPSNSEEIQADQIYMAPEVFLFMANESGKLDNKIDVYAMGLIFNQIMTGKLPEFDKEHYEYPYESILDNNSLVIDNLLCSLITNMVKKEPEERFNMSEVFNLLCGKNSKKEEIKYEEKKEYKPANSFFKKAGDL